MFLESIVNIDIRLELELNIVQQAVRLGIDTGARRIAAASIPHLLRLSSLDPSDNESGVIAYGSSRREWAARVQHGGLRVGGAPLASRKPGRQCEERSDSRDNGEQQRARDATSAGHRAGQGPGRPGAAVRDNLQNGDGLRVQRTRPGQRGWTIAEHQRPIVRTAATRQRGATARRRREGRCTQGRSYPGSVSKGSIPSARVPDLASR